MESIGDYLPLVRRVAGQVGWKLPKHVDRSDLFSAGSEGLLDAARRYNPAVGVAFGTYAEIRIRGAVLDQLRQADPVSRSMRKQQNSGAPGTPPAPHFVPLEESEAVELSDESVDCEESVSLRQELGRMWDAVKRLAPRMQKLLSLYYLEDLTLREIGEELNITESRVCQLHRDALLELRQALN